MAPALNCVPTRPRIECQTNATFFIRKWLPNKHVNDVIPTTLKRVTVGIYEPSSYSGDT